MDPMSLALLQQHAQQGQGGSKSGSSLSVSPNPGGQQQRIPSPLEMSIHTQQIMQNALIKHKLEEQKENYRKRNEGGSGKEPVLPGTPKNSGGDGGVNKTPKGTGSPAAASLAFTPTVVMKKFAADRRDSDPRPQIPELKISSQEQQNNNGRNGNGNSNVVGEVDQGSGGGGLSRFFSAEVLAQAASAGSGPRHAVGGPPLPPLSGALTLEEIEAAAAAQPVRI